MITDLLVAIGLGVRNEHALHLLHCAVSKKGNTNCEKNSTGLLNSKYSDDRI